jgi:hypothetical protein
VLNFSPDLGNISAIFDTDDIVFIADDSEVIDWLDGNGFQSKHILECENELPNAVISICTSWDHFKILGGLSKVSPHCQLISIPQVSFDPSPSAAVYSCMRLLESDFKDVLKSHNVWTETLKRTNSSIKFTGDDTFISCQLSNSIQIAAMDTLKLAHGNFRSAAEFFELGIEHSDGQEESCFSVSGTARVSGMLSAQAPTLDPSILHIVDKTNELVQLVAKSGYAILEVDNNYVTSFLVDGNELVHQLGVYAGGRGLQITEFAIGFNREIESSIDWTINSQMNEGIYGIHIGLGDGTTGMHMDLLCPGVTREIDLAVP